MEIDQLIFERELALNNIQRMVDCIDNESEFRVRTKELNNVKKSFFSVQLKIEKLLAKESKFDKEEQLKIRNSFDTLYYQVQVVLDAMKETQRKQSVANISMSQPCHAHCTSGGTTANSHIRLPKISLQTFDGKVTEWNAYYDLFKSIVHENQTLTNVERFRYLLSSLKGEPYNLLKTIQITDSNYEDALQILLTRYENKRIIATKHLDRILDLEPMSEKNIEQSLRNIMNTFSENYAALKALGINVSDWSFILLNVLLRKITPNIRKRFELSLYSPNEIPHCSELLDFLEKEMAATEIMSATARSSAGATAPPASRPHAAAGGSAGSATAFPSRHAQVGRRALSRSHSDAQQYNVNRNKESSFTRNMSVHAATAADYLKQIKCAYCKDNSHPLNKCDKFQKLSLSERNKFITENKVCSNCLFLGHETKDCKSRHNCRICSQRHHTSLHEDMPVQNVTLKTECSISSPELHSVAEPSAPPPTLGVSGPTNKNDCTVLLTTALVNVRPIDPKPFTPRLVRALVDQGSQVTLISESCVQRLGLPRFHFQTSATITGIGDKGEQPRGYVLCEVTPHYKPEPRLFIEALILPKITSYLPNIPDSFESISHLKNLPLADPELRSARPVELLLGSDYSDSILLHDNIKGPQGTPVAINSIFGYLLNGKISHSLPAPQVCMNLSTSQLDKTIQRFWDIESVPDDEKPLTKDETFCESIFVETHKRADNGKYIVSLPFKKEAPPLGESRDIALSRLYKLEKRLSHDPALRADYNQCLQEYVDLGHMEPVPTPTDSDTPSYYIPHHCVVKKSAVTSKTRVVFDASCKTTSGRSLNDNLLIGQKLHQDITDVLLKFRLHKIVFTADIKMMYRFIDICQEHRDFQRILWRFSPLDPVQEYRLCTVTFGVSSAPFLALRTLRQLAVDEAASFPLASQVLLNEVFVDDIVSGSDCVDNALVLQRELIAICKAGTFELRKWTSNSPEFLSSLKQDNSNQDDALILSALDNDTSVKVLGLKWNPILDTFTYQTEAPAQKCTKRIMLAEISKIYDPLGFLSPITLFVKHLIQLLWVSGTEWDDCPPDGIRDLWFRFVTELPQLQDIKLYRPVLPCTNDVQLHGFSDASEKAYAACVYLRVVDSDGVIYTPLLLAKTKVAPLKRLSLPRLELCGALLLSKLVQKILGAYSTFISIDKVFAWCDSSITLAWLRSPPHEWRTYVSNRITETTNRVPASQWHHVRSADNPADVASRGALPSELDQRQWFDGPYWLRLPESDWPISNVDIDIISTDEERRKHVLVSNVEPDIQLFERFSSLSKMLRIISLCFRFFHKCRKSKTYESSQITVHETKFALNRVISLVQQENFAEDIARIKNDDVCTKRLRKLKPFLDDAGLLRVGGRINRANVPYDAKHQILLPKRHHFTNLLIDFYHLTNLHVGPQTLQFLLAQTYWILSARDAVRMRTRRCVRCFRTRPVAPQPSMAPLPAARVRVLRPFLHVGVDFAGHFFLKSNKFRNAKVFKSYVCVFVCMSTKATHLELVPDLTTDSFLNALRRFISRRGLCTDIYSDCGRNFVGCDRYLSDLFEFLRNEDNQNIINKQLTNLAVTWHFNPPYASHFGGIFEAAVKSMKTHLFRVIGQLTLSYDEFNTLLCQIEAVLNSRPLFAQSNDPADPLPITPGHFLIGEPLTSLPEFNLTDDNPSRLVRWQVLQQAVQHFWKRWSVDYLHQLQQRSKWFRNDTHTPLREGSVVVLADNTLPPLKWRLARVHQLHPGADGITRVVTVRIGNTLAKRPVVKVCPLPFE